MAIGITGWRLHIGAISPTPVPPRFIREFYEVVPDGVDITTNSLTIQQLSDPDLDEAVKGMERAAKQLSRFDADLVYQLGVPPIVLHGPGFHNQVRERLEKASGLPAITDMNSVIDAMRAMSLDTLVMATPFADTVNDRLDTYLAAEGIKILHKAGLGLVNNVEIRRLPISAEYTFARQTYEQSAQRPAGLYIPCGGWGSIHNIDKLERDLDTTVITWMNALIWSSMKRHGVKGPIKGFGRLLETL